MMANREHSKLVLGAWPGESILLFEAEMVEGNYLVSILFRIAPQWPWESFS